MCNVATRKRSLTSARSKGKGGVTVTLDQVYLTACRTHGSISFTAGNHRQMDGSCDTMLSCRK